MVKFFLKRPDFIVLLCFLSGVALLIDGCTRVLVTRMTGPMPFSEVARTPHPAGQMDAVLVRRHAHSTVSDPFELFFVPKGQPVTNDLEPVSRADHAHLTQIAWKDERTLLVESPGARYFHQEVKASRVISGEPITVESTPPRLAECKPLANSSTLFLQR